MYKLLIALMVIPWVRSKYRIRFLPVFILLAGSSTAVAQSTIGQFGTRIGSGLEVGTGASPETVRRHTPVFIDLDVRTWTDERGDFIYGGSLRAEVDGRSSVAAVPRIEVRHPLKVIELRPGLAVPMFIAPFLMFGVEMGVSGRIDIGAGFGLLAAVTATGFFIGNDVPDDSVVLMFNGSLGVDIET